MWKRPRVCILPSRLTMRKPRRESMCAARTISALCDPAASRQSPRMLLPPVLQCCGGVQEAAGVADAMIEAWNLEGKTIHRQREWQVLRRPRRLSALGKPGPDAWEEAHGNARDNYT